MSSLVVQGRIGAQGNALTVDISDLTVQVIDGQSYVLSSTGANGGLVAYQLHADALVQQTGQVWFSDAVSGAVSGQLDVMAAGGQNMVLVGGDAAGGRVGYALEAGGSFGGMTQIGDLTAPQTSTNATVRASAPGFVYMANPDSGTIHCFAEGAGGSFAAGAVTQDTQDSHLSTPIELAELRVGGKDYLLALCQSEVGVSAYEINPVTGHLDLTGRFGVGDGLGLLSVPVAMQTVHLNGQGYVVVASAAGNTGNGGALSVLRLAQDGTLQPADHVLDSLDTRFGQVQSLSVVQDGDWTYVIAGGGDDGISVFAMMPGGQLLYLASLADSMAAGLDNVSAVTGALTGDTLQILAASQTEAGLTQIGMSVAGRGDVIHGGGLLEGGVLADLVTGRSSSDTLVGGAGNDTLRDGAGVDTLTGGAGNDVFVLDMDGARDVISDFRAGQDLLDLSFFWMLYDLSGLEIVSTSWGALLTWRGEETELHSFNDKSIGRAQVMSSVLPAGDRPPLVLADAPADDGGDDGGDGGDDGDDGDVGDGGGGGNDTGGGTDGTDTVGTSGDDSLVGTAAGETVAGFAGDDRIEGRGGNDHLTGGNGQDTILGETGNDEIHGQGGQDRILGGAGSDLIYGGIGFDTIEAGDGADTVWGGDGRDLILLNQGNDLFGDSAQNDIYGRDTVFGGFGADTLLGGGGDDELHGQFDNDSIQGGLGQDKLFGGTGFDTISGGAGNDTVWGGDGRDLIWLNQGNDVFWDAPQEGEYGRDTVRGGWGHDTLNGGAGDDELHGEADNDSVLGGAGHDRIYGGTGFDTVAAGNGNDTVWGGDGRDLIWLNQGADVFWDSGQNDANGNDTVFGGFGHDTLNGGGGADQLFGEIDNDSISGGIGSDILNGGDGYDTLRGGADNDTIYGGDRADLIFGDGGADVLVSGNGNDTLTGGTGADRFVFRTPDGFNRITDFTPGEDLIVMQVNETGFDQLTTQNWAKGLLLEWDGGQVLLEGVTAGQFQPADVVFE